MEPKKDRPAAKVEEQPDHKPDHKQQREPQKPDPRAEKFGEGVGSVEEEEGPEVAELVRRLTSHVSGDNWQAAKTTCADLLTACANAPTSQPALNTGTARVASAGPTSPFTEDGIDLECNKCLAAVGAANARPSANAFGSPLSSQMIGLIISTIENVIALVRAYQAQALQSKNLNS